MSKRILFVANVAKEHVIKFHIPTIKLFKDRGWTVDVACSGDEVVPYCDHQYNMCWKRSPFTIKTIIGVKELKTILKQECYDIVYCHTPVGGLTARLAAKKYRKNGLKVIYFAHGFHFYKGAPKLNWMIYYPIEKLLSKYTDKIITINDEDYNIASNHFSKKTNAYKVPGIGVDFGKLKIDELESTRNKYRKQLNIQNNAVVLIYVAELIENKNQGMLLNMLSVLCKRHGNVHLLLVGPDHNDGLYQRMAMSLGLGNDVSFLGWRKDIAQLFTASDICVASSIREGFGINLVEAMYCKIPVIATKNRGHSTIIENGKNGYLVEKDDVDTMADIIMGLISSPEKYSEITETAFEGLDKYSVDEVASKLYKIICE